MKTKEELNAIKAEYAKVKGMLAELNEDELTEVTGGVNIWDIAVKIKSAPNAAFLDAIPTADWIENQKPGDKLTMTNPVSGISEEEAHDPVVNP